MISNKKPSQLEYGELYAEYMKVIEKLEKDLEVLEILKTKRVDLKRLYHAASVGKYNNDTWGFISANLTKQEFKLLKGWLDND